jgi:hypothetical protein
MWDTIERERLAGYDHRAPKSRSKKIEVKLLGGAGDESVTSSGGEPLANETSDEREA